MPQRGDDDFGDDDLGDDDLGWALDGVLAATAWPEIAEVLTGLPGERVAALAEALWDRAWRHLADGDHDLARQVGLLGELVDRVGMVGTDGAVEAFVEFGTLTAALDEVIELAAAASGEDPAWFAVRHDIGVLCAQRFAAHGDPADLDAAVDAFGEAVGAPGVADRADAWIGLGSALWRRFTTGTDPADLRRGLHAAARAVEAAAQVETAGRDETGDRDEAAGRDGTELAGYAHNVRGNLLKERYDWFGDPADLDAAIEAYHRAVECAAPEGPDRDGFGGNLAMALSDRFLRSGDDADLAAAQQLTGAVISAAVGPRLELRAEELNRPEDLAAVQARIAELDEAVAGQPPYAPDRFLDLAALGSALHARWGRRGDPADLRRALGCHRRALLVAPPRSTSWPVRAYAVANTALSAGAVDEAIRWAGAALDPLPPAAPLRPAAASLLGSAYYARYDRTGDVEDLSTAITHLDAALAACPRGSRELPGLANNLGNALRRRFHRLREVTDLDAAVAHLQHALDATEPGSVNRPGLHRNLAAALTDAQQALLAEGGTGTDLVDDAITAAQAAARAFPPGHPDHHDGQEILAGAWLQRALTTGHRADFDHAVTAARAATTGGGEHASTLANCLAERFHRFGDDTDRAEAATRYRRLATDPAQPDETALRDARNWGIWSAGHGAWPDATEAFDEATRRAARLYHTQRSELGTAEWLGYTDGLPHWAALAHHRTGDTPGAVTAFETGRAVLLRAALPTDPAPAASIPAEPAPAAVADPPVPAHVVHLAATRLGGLALITDPQGAVTGLELPGLTLDALVEQVNTLLQAHHHRRAAPATWYRSVLDLTGWAHDAVLGPLLDALPPDPRLVLIPGGGGVLVPWHAAWPAGADTRHPEPACARATISYAPHHQALRTAHRLAARAGPPRHLLSIVDPPHAGTPRLPDAHAEATALAAHFPRHTHLAGPAATRAAVLHALGHPTDPVHTLLAACHAVADLADPTNSALLLADQDRLTVAELHQGPRPVRPLRLALLTACQSAQPGAHLPDETINLPTALLRTGCAATVGTLWSVPSRTAALFTTLFLDAWRTHWHDPAAATRAALTTLRTLDTAHERRLLPDLPPPDGVPASFRSHAHPARWAAFLCTGW